MKKYSSFATRTQGSSCFAETPVVSMARQRLRKINSLGQRGLAASLLLYEAQEY